jgi:hypothetical protein
MAEKSEVRVTIATMDGNVLETLVVEQDMSYAVYKEVMLAHTVREAIEEQFETKDD